MTTPFTKMHTSTFSEFLELYERCSPQQQREVAFYLFGIARGGHGERMPTISQFIREEILHLPLQLNLQLKKDTTNDTY